MFQQLPAKLKIAIKACYTADIDHYVLEQDDKVAEKFVGFPRCCKLKHFNQ